MTEQADTQKKPILEPIDEKEIAEGRRSYLEEIGAAKARRDDYKFRMDTAKKHTTPTMKAHFAVMHIMQHYHVDTLETFLNFAESFVEMYQKIGVALETLEKQICEISEKTGVDISQIKTEVAQVKETVNAPIYKYLKEQKEADERIRKKGEEWLDSATRSH